MPARGIEEPLLLKTYSQKDAFHVNIYLTISLLKIFPTDSVFVENEKCTWNSGTVESMSMMMLASKNRELTITSTWDSSEKQQLVSCYYLGCRGGVWIFKQFPDDISQLGTAHSIKWINLLTEIFETTF